MKTDLDNLLNAMIALRKVDNSSANEAAKKAVGEALILHLINIYGHPAKR